MDIYAASRRVSGTTLTRMDSRELDELSAETCERNAENLRDAHHARACSIARGDASPDIESRERMASLTDALIDEDEELSDEELISEALHDTARYRGIELSGFEELTTAERGLL